MLQILTTSIFDSTKIVIYLNPNKAGLFEGSFFEGRVNNIILKVIKKKSFTLSLSLSFFFSLSLSLEEKFLEKPQGVVKLTCQPFRVKEVLRFGLSRQMIDV